MLNFPNQPGTKEQDESTNQFTSSGSSLGATLLGLELSPPKSAFLDGGLRNAFDLPVEDAEPTESRRASPHDE